MNLKFLKFLVGFMGILIIIGIILLIVGIYDKMQATKQSNLYSKTNIITINKPLNMKFISYIFKKDKLTVSYENNEKLKIIILDLSDGKKIKEIDILK